MLKNNKLIHNAKWIIICRVIQSLLQFVIGMLSARYLGPSNYGLVNYAASVVAFVVPIMQLGLGETLVQEYVSLPERDGEILGTSLLMNFASAVACMVGVCCFVAAANPGEQETLIVCALYSVSLLFQGMDLMKFWFQAKLKSKYSSLAALIAYIVVSAYKLYLLISAKNVYWFALSHAVEYAATAVLLLWAFKSQKGGKVRFSRKLAGALLSRSRHYIMANLMVKVFQNAGPVVLKNVFGEAANGYYAAATTCTCITSFVFAAIIDTARPVIIESRKISQEAFEKNVTRLYSLTTYLSLAQSVVFTLCAQLIVKILYGEDYVAAVPVLQIMVWNLAFSYMGSVRNIWILGEEKYSILWIINLCGAVASVLLNACLIPLWGASGAAVASVLVQVFTNFVMGFILKPIRRNNYLLLRGLNPKYIFELIPMLKSS